MKMRQIALVQGRVEDGTLFPQISTRIREGMEEITDEAFKTLQGTLLKLARDTEAAVDEAAQICSTGPKHQELIEATKRQEEFLDEIQRLKKKHSEVMSRVAAF